MNLLKKVHSGVRHIECIQKWRYLSKKQRRSYDSDFKTDAVRLSNEPGRTVAEVSDAPGIRSELLYRWRSVEKKNGKLAFPGHGTEALTPEQKRIRELEKALKDA